MTHIKVFEDELRKCEEQEAQARRTYEQLKDTRPIQANNFLEVANFECSQAKQWREMLEKAKLFEGRSVVSNFVRQLLAKKN